MQLALQVGRAARDGRQGACVILAPNTNRQNKTYGKLFNSAKSECLVEGQAKLFSLANPDGDCKNTLKSYTPEFTNK